ncbi:hypothetical protein M0805_006660 [Coniferiporia weirii]|nr:hypothetical protein M0805_006660 [Coniferiporia weirii]
MPATIHSAPALLTTRDDGDVNCGDGGGDDSLFGLRVASIFIIMFTSMTGALFPTVVRRSRMRNFVPKSAFDFAKYFGSGVIIATAFIHLLDPATDELGSSCLSGTWQEYPWALALCMLSIFIIFFVELIAFRWGTSRLTKLGISYDAHGHEQGISHAAHGPERSVMTSSRIPEQELDTNSAEGASSDIEKNDTSHSHSHHTHSHHVLSEASSDALAQIVGIFILEFGILLHSILIGLTLAVSSEFKVLFVVIIFHQTFEGLGLGSRLAYLDLPAKYNYVAYCAAILYGLTTPIGIAAGLGVRSTYNPNSTLASIVSGVLDSLSAGVLIYTGLVELLAHEFLFNPEMRVANDRKLAYACVCMIFGAGIMALLGRWA